jgi:2-C-methyl-D-erythritol 4-phosphate cytidylyltransferase
VLVAAGRGERLGTGAPKQFRLLGGRPLFAHSLKLFDALDWIDAIALVLPPGGLPDAFQGELNGLRHAVRCVEGGARRQDSVATGLVALCEATGAGLQDPNAAKPGPTVGAMAEAGSEKRAEARSTEEHGTARPPAEAGGNQGSPLKRAEASRWTTPRTYSLQPSVYSLDLALVHDVARPFPDPAVIARLARLAMVHGGGLLAVRAADTVKRAQPDGADGGRRLVAETLDRESIWLAQTPQAIRGDLVARAIADLRRLDLEVTDEASLLESWGLPVALIESSADNFKITHPADFARAEALLSARTRTRSAGR